MTNLIPPSGNGDRPSHRPPRIRLSKRDRNWLLCATLIIVVLALADGFWSDALFPLLVVFVMLLITAFVELPYVAFGTVAAVIFVLGCCLRWPPKMARVSPAKRGFALLAVVFVLQAIWFQFGWMPFWPPCSGSFDPFYGGETLLKGPLNPEAAGQFVDILQRQYSEGAARLSGDHTVLVRPAIALFPSGLHWNYTLDIAEDLGGRTASESCRTMEQALMAGGRAESQLVGYGYWPWNTFDEEGVVVQWLLSLHKDD